MPKLTATTLTAAFCRSAKPGVELTEKGEPVFVRAAYPDREVRGLELRVAASGEKTWSFRYRDRITAKQSRINIGVFDPTVDAPADGPGETRRLTLQGARVAARGLRAKVDAGVDPAAELRTAREKAKAQVFSSMSELADAYFVACKAGTHRAGKRKKAASTIANEEWMWGKYLKPRIDKDTPDKVTRTRIKNVLKEVFAIAPGQSNKCRALLSQMFNYAADEAGDEDKIAVNPVARIKKLTEDTARTRRLTDTELKRVWGALENPTGLRIVTEDKDEPVLVSEPVRLAMQLCLILLQRRAEVSGMHKDELDLVNKTWLIPEDRTKGHAEHLVPLPDMAVAIIKKALKLHETRKKAASSWVFPSPRTDGPIGASALSHAMADITAALGIEDATLHDLRRTGATGIAALGVPPFVVSKVLSHKDADGAATVTNRHYNLYAYLAEKRDALDRWAAKLEQLFELTPAQRDAPNVGDEIGRAA